MSSKPNDSVAMQPAAAVFTLFTPEVSNGLLRDVLSTERGPLSSIHPSTLPGVYILFARRATKSLRQYGEEIASGMYPIYLGKAQNLSERLGRHRKTIAAARGLSVDDFAVGFMYTATEAEALAVEGFLIKELRPPWNEPALAGFGSRYQGNKRCTQRISAFDCLHQRGWARKATATERSSVRSALHAYSVSGHARALWPAFA